MKLIIITQCRIEKEVESINAETIQNAIEELHDAPVGQVFEGQEIFIGEE